MKRQSGFTLMEVLFTMMVAGILVGLGVPSFKTSVQNNRLVSQANDLLGMLLYSRSQAVLSNDNVTVCASNNTNTSTPSCSGTDWSKGWIVCQEASNGNTGCASGYTVLRIESALSGGNSLTNASNLSKITFSPATGGLTTGNSLYFDLCDSRGASYGRAIYVYSAGQARVSTTPGKQLDGITALTC
jgi:type IV fimbrial biogenesis protein FimT